MKKYAKSAGALAVGVVAAITVVWMPSPAEAATQPEMVVGDGITVWKSDGTPTASNPGPQNSDTEATIDPAACAVSENCDTIPVRFDIPEVGPSDDVRVKFEITWNGDADFDVFFWDNRQNKKDVEPGESQYLQLGKSQESSQPERITILNPVLDSYNFTVLAWLYTSNSTQITITAEMIVDEFTPPLERLPEPPQRPTTTEATTESTTTSTTISVGPPSTFQIPTTLPPVDTGIDFDASFDEFTGNDVTAPPTGNFSFGNSEDTGADKPDPPSALSMLLATVVLPAGLVTPVGLRLSRRRKAMQI